MANFNERERSEEKKFQLSQELEFKAQARRNKLLGLWAAGLMGHSADAAEAYAKTVVASDFEEAGDDDVFRKVKGDLGGKVSDADLRVKMAELLAEARAQVKAGV